MKELINKAINNYYHRLTLLEGSGRYFEREFLTDEMLEDKQFYNDIIDASRLISKMSMKNKPKDNPLAEAE